MSDPKFSFSFLRPSFFMSELLFDFVFAGVFCCRHGGGQGLIFYKDSFIFMVLCSIVKTLETIADMKNSVQAF